MAKFGSSGSGGTLSMRCFSSSTHRCSSAALSFTDFPFCFAERTPARQSANIIRQARQFDFSVMQLGKPIWFYKLLLTTDCNVSVIVRKNNHNKKEKRENIAFHLLLYWSAMLLSIAVDLAWSMFNYECYARSRSVTIAYQDAINFAISRLSY